MKIIYGRKNKKYDITQFVTQVVWSGSANEASRSLEISMINSPFDDAMKPPKLKPGDQIWFYPGEKLRFYGHITIAERNGEKGEVTYTARDLMFNLIKSRISKKFKKKTPEYIAKACAKAAGIKVGSLYKTKTKIKKQYATEESCYNIIMNSYAQAAAKKHIQFFPRMNGEKFEVKRKGAVVATLDQQKDITALRITTNAEDMVNRVNIYDKKGKKTGTVKKQNWIRSFGVFQEAYTKGKKTSGKKQAKARLKGKRQEMEIDAIGNVKCIAGAGVYVYDKISGVTGNFWIQSDSHTWRNGIHTMSLQMTFKNVTEKPDVNYDSGSGSKSKSGTKYVSTGVMIGKKISGLMFTCYAPGEGGYNDMKGRRLNPSEKTVAFDRLSRMYGKNGAYGMKVQIFEKPKTRYHKKVMTNRDTGTGSMNKVDVLMTKSQERSWPNPHGHVIVAKKERYKKKKVKTGGGGVNGATAGSKADKIIRLAKSYIGKVKWILGANNVPGGRADCSAFTQYIFRKAAGKHIGRTTKDQVRKGKKISKISKLKPGDLILLNTVGYCSHVGIYIGKGKMLHNSTSKGPTIVTIKSGYYRKCFLCGRRVLKESEI